MGCNRRTAHEHIISCLKLSLAKQAKQTLPERLMQHFLTGKLALDVVQQCWLQTARLHYFIDLSRSRRHMTHRVAGTNPQITEILLSEGCHGLCTALQRGEPSLQQGVSNVQCYFFSLLFLHLQHLEPCLSVCKGKLLSF